GGVQAGALAMMSFPAAGTGPALPGLAAGLNVHATTFAAENAIVLDPSVPPFVSLDFARRTTLLVQILDGTGPDQLAYFALAGIAIPAYYLSAGGARVVMLERGPRLATADFTQDLRLDTYTRIVDLINGTGMSVVAGNCVGGGSVVYFAASLRAPSFVFERQGT